MALLQQLKLQKTLTFAVKSLFVDHISWNGVVDLCFHRLLLNKNVSRVKVQSRDNSHVPC